MKRKININRPKLTSEEIAKSKDFSSVLKAFNKLSIPFYKSTWFVSSSVAAAVTVVTIAGYLGFNNKPTEKGNKEIVVKQDSLNKPFINPPFENVNIERKKYIVKAEDGGELRYKTGSIIKIPKKAFIDKDGNPIKGNVDVYYREFHDPVDFFVSGIPMTYDSAGTQYHFESAGMFEILASKDGEQVFLKPDKEIAIAMASNNSETRHNLYQLDTVNKNWVFKGKDNIVKLSEDDIKKQNTLAAKELAQEIEALKEEIKEVEKTKPIEPKKADENKNSLNIKLIDEKEFPEIAIYKGVKFELSEENKSFNAKDTGIIWEDVQLERTGKDKYIVKFSTSTQSRKYVAYPVLEGVEYETAVKEFEQRFKKYQEILTARKQEEMKKQIEYKELLAKNEEEKAATEKRIAEEKKRLEEINLAIQKKQIEKAAELQKQWDAEQEKIKKQNEEKLKQWKEYKLAEQKKWEEYRAAQQKLWEEQQRLAYERASTQEKVMREFTINNFGIWNCDSPQNLPQGNCIIAKFNDKANNNLKFQNVYLIEKNRKAIFTYKSYSFGKFQYNPKCLNMAWGITSNNKIAIVRYEDFSMLPETCKEYTFTMEVSDKEFKTPEEIKAFLNI